MLDQRGADPLAMDWFDVLVNLMLEPEHHTRMGVLAERCTLSFSRLSRVIAEIEASGYVERQADPDDGRAVLVRPTDAGRQLTQRAFDLHLEDVKERFARHLTEDQAQTIIQGLSAVLRSQGQEPSPLGAWIPDRWSSLARLHFNLLILDHSLSPVQGLISARGASTHPDSEMSDGKTTLILGRLAVELVLVH